MRARSRLPIPCLPASPMLIWEPYSVSAHENLVSFEEVRTPSDQSFGRVFTGVFLLFGLWPLWRGAPVRIWSLAASAIVLLLTSIRPSLLHPANVLWTRAGLLLQRLVSPVMMAAIFLLVVTPIGLLLRALGKDLLRLRLDPAAPSYWIHRMPPGPSADSMEKQF